MPPAPPPTTPPSAKMPGNSLGARTCRLGAPHSTWHWLCKLLNPLYVSGFIIWKVGVMVGLSSWWLRGLNEVRNATSSRGAWCAVCAGQGFALPTHVSCTPPKKGCWWLMLVEGRLPEQEGQAQPTAASIMQWRARVGGLSPWTWWSLQTELPFNEKSLTCEISESGALSRWTVLAFYNFITN